MYVLCYISLYYCIELYSIQMERNRAVSRVRPPLRSRLALLEGAKGVPRNGGRKI